MLGAACTCPSGSDGPGFRVKLCFYRFLDRTITAALLAVCLAPVTHLLSCTPAPEGSSQAEEVCVPFYR